MNDSDDFPRQPAVPLTEQQTAQATGGSVLSQTADRFSQGGPHWCPVCQKEFSTITSYHLHLKTHMVKP